MIGSCRRSDILTLLGLSPEEFSVQPCAGSGQAQGGGHLVPLGKEGNTAYYRDENQVHYVPKRSLEDILL